MRSFFLNFLVALAVFAGVFWYYFSKDQAEITTMADRYGVSIPSASAPTPAPTGVPTIDTGSKN